MLKGREGQIIEREQLDLDLKRCEEIFGSHGKEIAKKFKDGDFFGVLHTLRKMVAQNSEFGEVDLDSRSSGIMQERAALLNRLLKTTGILPRLEYGLGGSVGKYALVKDFQFVSAEHYSISDRSGGVTPSAFTTHDRLAHLGALRLKNQSGEGYQVFGFDA